METEPRGDGEATTSLVPERLALEAVESADAEASVEVMGLLNEGVPLALLADLANRDGPPSPAILEDEGLPEVAWWEPDEHVEVAEQDVDATKE